MAVYILLLILVFVLIYALKCAYTALVKPGLKVPSLSNESKYILTLPASVLSEKLKNVELRSEQIVQAYINRIKEVNGLINAVVEPRFEEALDEARKVDKKLENMSENEREAVFKEKVLKYFFPINCNYKIRIVTFNLFK